ncbi:hypothetical protein BKA57DRAFT_448664 [Linnemannia elongata]|nr:hypothetical protein BKA57DRAFT_448664 [Linnemannia elongata]
MLLPFSLNRLFLSSCPCSCLPSHFCLSSHSHRPATPPENSLFYFVSSSGVFFHSAFLSSYSCSLSLFPLSSLPFHSYPHISIISSSIIRTTNTTTNWVHPSYEKLSSSIGNSIINIISLPFSSPLFSIIFFLYSTFPFFNYSLTHRCCISCSVEPFVDGLFILF